MRSVFSWEERESELYNNAFELLQNSVHYIYISIKKITFILASFRNFFIKL